MSNKHFRINQINTFIQQRFGEVVNQELELPAGAIVSITRVKTSKDLRHAKVGISIFPDDKTDTIFSKICQNLKHLKFLTHQQITFKYAPDIKVYIDDTARKAFKMEALLDKVKEKREEPKIKNQ